MERIEEVQQVLGGFLSGTAEGNLVSLRIGKLWGLAVASRYTCCGEGGNPRRMSQPLVVDCVDVGVAEPFCPGFGDRDAGIEMDSSADLGPLRWCTRLWSRWCTRWTHAAGQTNVCPRIQGRGCFRPFPFPRKPFPPGEYSIVLGGFRHSTEPITGRSRWIHSKAKDHLILEGMQRSARSCSDPERLSFYVPGLKGTGLTPPRLAAGGRADDRDPGARAAPPG